MTDDPEALRRDRDQARRELGETVAELTDKFDVPARTKDKVHETTEAAKHRVTDAKYQALYTADKARDKAGQVVGKVESSVPDPVVDRGRQAADLAARKPQVPVAAAAVFAALLVWFLARRRRA
ncbi:DUF3618 domain-containing protein [Nocardia rosealba]|uniref:DUF3618 domain-containing protein n=1 Tax=Nocardia TaxID=1817 RepID=UPI001CD9BC7C|nr:DUF3618 domain-containing protein [Nocardia rosealba]MCA2207458.1 DUF3618 domain-containing protein [Nocardia rosealba]